MVDHRLFMQRERDAPDHAAEQLAPDEARIDDAPRRERADQARHADLAEDVLRALIGMCYMHDQPGWQSTVLRLLDVFVDGLRVQPEGKRKARPSTKRAT